MWNKHVFRVNVHVLVSPDVVFFIPIALVFSHYTETVGRIWSFFVIIVS
jgi:hypothetical protein